jgi:O-methyltransferase
VATENNQEKIEQAVQTIKEACQSSSFFWGDRLLSLDKSAGFLKDENFRKYFEQLQSDNKDLSIAWRMHVLLWAVKSILHLEGDLVECGTFLGDMAWMIVKFFQFEKINKKFFLYDSFHGLHDKYASKNDYPEGMGTYDFLKEFYQKNSNYEFVTQRFSAYKNVIITKGYLPEVLDTVLSEQIAFLHIDLNSPYPEYKTIERLYDILVPGAIVIYDDYGWEVFEKQKIAADTFAQQKGISILELPTGQGLFIKR